MKTDLLLILTISPVPSIITLRLPVPHEAVLLLQVVNSDQPPAIKPTLSERVRPVMLNVREEIFVSSLKISTLHTMDKNVSRKARLD